jgi:hypothetical protein
MTKRKTMALCIFCFFAGVALSVPVFVLVARRLVTFHMLETTTYDIEDSVECLQLLTDGHISDAQATLLKRLNMELRDHDFLRSLAHVPDPVTGIVAEASTLLDQLNETTEHHPAPYPEQRKSAVQER